MKKSLHIFKNIFVWLMFIFAVAMMIFTIVSVTMFDHIDRNIFGYRAFIVLSDSMSATDFEAGDLVLVKEVDPATLQEGDIIAYQSTGNENYGEVVTHKIRKLTEDAEGNPGFITYGTTTGDDDENIVTYNFVLGKYKKALPGVGRFFYFLKTTPGYILCIFLPFLLLILMQGVNTIRLFRQYKKEQMADLKKERAMIEQERIESQRMLEELNRLKEQLGSAGIDEKSQSSYEKE